MAFRFNSFVEHDRQKPNVGWSYFALCLVFVLAGGCQRGVPAATDTLEAYRQALVENDSKAAYDLLAPSTQKELSYSEFKVSWDSSALERKTQANHLRDIFQDGSEKAHVTSHQRYLATLTREKNKWRVDSPYPTPLGAKTPKDAIARFAIRLEQSDAALILALFSETKRLPLEREYASFLSGLSESLKWDKSEYPVNDSRVDYRFATTFRRYKIILVKQELLGWLIDDIVILPTLREP